ncbi:hypothetical protein [Halotia branconii]|uniref:Uncharacterized protein n=1 Tax=Halotia branconii CENA392 TaxID=1539056 RepID=A0AAJ6NQC6_9CYAN|nr:hypothetical protein [Halotia branconii]WGV24665.1 hypothetical protein QI031_23285 [Halotia branconii CENA392]
MSNQMITFPLLVDLSTDEQQFIAGGLFGYFSNCGGQKQEQKPEPETNESPNCDCGRESTSMYIGYKITVTPFSYCVGGETGKWCNWLM